MVKFFLAMFVVLMSATWSHAQSGQIPCTVEIQTIEDLEGCEGKEVTLTGLTPSEVPTQHPTGRHDAIDLATGQTQRQRETVVDFDKAQLVLTSVAPIECTGGMTVTGVVDVVALGGAEGKDSYKNVWIRVGEVSCE